MEGFHVSNDKPWKEIQVFVFMSDIALSVSG